MDELNTAVIGVGGHARGHLQMIKNAEEMRLVAVCDINEGRLERAKAEYGAENAFKDYREMIDKCDLDVVYVVTQPDATADISIYCLERGLHTSVEKPPGLSAADTRRILEAEIKSDGIAIVSFNRRYIPEVLAVRKMALDRGGAVHCAATYNKPVVQMRDDWGRSMLICDAIHHVDLLRWFASRVGPRVRGGCEEKEGLGGDAVAVYSESYLGDSSDKQRHNAVIKFAGGCRGVMMSHYAVGFRIQRAEVHAENFSAYLDLTAAPRCEVYEDGKPYEKPLDLDSVGGRDFNETRHFIKCIKESKRPWSNLEDAVKTMQLCEAILQGVKGDIR